MKRQLISSREAIPAKKQHTKPCSDCPWSRGALPGWLGSLSSDDWITIAHSDSVAECHALTGVHCAGLAIYRANVVKSVRDPAALRLPRDHKAVFSSPVEFKCHHENVAAYFKEEEPS
jgi:hypothetical protein